VTGAPLLSFPTWPSLAGLPLDAMVTTRHGGVSAGPYASLNLGRHVGDDPSAVDENWRRAAAALGCRPDDIVTATQVHGRDVVVVGDPDPGPLECDGLATATPGVAVGVLAADCATLVIYAPDAHALTCVHAGWKGTTLRTAAAGVDALAGLGADPARLRVGIGPTIAAGRYQVGEEVAAAARDCFGRDAGDALRPDGTGRWTFDLVTANRRVLADAGVDPAHVEASPGGTGPGTPYFSDRAQRPCGRFALLARLR
jgi:YfiH family protein